MNHYIQTVGTLTVHGKYVNEFIYSMMDIEYERKYHCNTECRPDLYCSLT